MTHGFIHIADHRTYWLRNVRISAFSRQHSAFGSVDRDGLVDADIRIESGTIAAIERPGEERSEAQFDLAGGQVWPAFVDLHTHLDKNHIWPRVQNPDGTIDSARAYTAADRVANWSAADVEPRFEFGLRCAYAHGTAAIRSHLDCFELRQAQISFGVFRKLRDSWSGRLDVQAASLTTLDAYLGDAGAELADLVAQSGGLLGGITRMAPPHENTSASVDAGLDRLFQLAIERGLNIDLHVDESGDPAANTLAQVARAIMRHRYKGQVVCGHCCSLSVQSDDVVARTIDLCRGAGLTVVSLPMVNQFLQGRIADQTPRWRGITLLKELRAGGVAVAIGSDNCRDPYFAFGDLDLLEVFTQAVRIGHLDVGYPRWPEAVTTTPAQAMGLARRGKVEPGAKADLVLFRGRNFSELFARQQADRVVLRGGRPIDTTLPDYRELDALLLIAKGQ